MVSTRGVKLKFFEGERVLCYEPDPTKAKVLYDSKVLDIIVNKDQRGRKTVEYLIHFQGWNSSWDRCVREEFVLKDTAENRQLQKDLAEKAQLQLGAYLYRRERKKHGRKTSEPVVQSSEDGSSGSPARIDTDDGREPTSSSDDESSGEEDSIQIELTPDLKQILEQDHFLINTKNKLPKLPAEPNVVSILETYWKHYATNQMCGLTEKPNTRHRQPYNQQPKYRPEDLQRNLNICKEVIDGIRIYFDFTLNTLLLYNREQGQVQTQPAILNSSNTFVKKELGVKTQLEDLEYAHLPNVVTDEECVCQQEGDVTNQKPATRRRGLRSDRSVDSNSNGNSQPDSNNVKPCSSVSSNSSDVSGPMIKTLAWKLLPDNIYSQKPPPPSLMYGAVHLLRLLVKLPELLNASSITDEKLKVLLRHMDTFVDFMNEHKEWYGEKCYSD